MRLRGLKEKDVNGMLEWMLDPEIQKYFRVDMTDKKEIDALEFINSASIGIGEGQSIHYAITDETDEYLGTISLKDIDLTARNAEYAISLRKKAQGKGIATEATDKILRLAFYEFKLERVYLNVLSENERAIRLYEKCGFVYEGEFRKHLFLKGEFKTLRWYSILKEEYILRSGGGINNIYIKALPICSLIWLDDKYDMEVA